MSGINESAVTVHRVFEDYDSTKGIIAVKKVPILPGDPTRQLGESVQNTEKAWVGPIVSDYLWQKRMQADDC